MFLSFSLYAWTYLKKWSCDYLLVAVKSFILCIFSTEAKTSRMFGSAPPEILRILATENVTQNEHSYSILTSVKCQAITVNIHQRTVYNTIIPTQLLSAFIIVHSFQDHYSQRSSANIHQRSQFTISSLQTQLMSIFIGVHSLPYNNFLHNYCHNSSACTVYNNIIPKTNIACPYLTVFVFVYAALQSLSLHTYTLISASGSCHGSHTEDVNTVHELYSIGSESRFHIMLTLFPIIFYY